MSTIDETRQRLRDAGLRVTRPRVAVLRAVAGHPHADAGVLLEATRVELPDVSHQAVYDSLHTLTDAGLVRCIQPSGATARYETRVGDNHHHLVCRGCGEIVDVDCEVGEAPCVLPDDDHGFSVDEAEVVYWGLCPRCRASVDAGAVDSDAADVGQTDAGPVHVDAADADVHRADAVRDAD